MPSRPPRQRDFREPGSLPRWRIGVGAAVVAVLAVLAVGVVLSAVSRAGSATSTVEVDPGGPRPSTSVTDEPSSGPGLFVHILGRVKHAGLYELDPGSRAIDVVTAAGGFEPDADQGSLNLARPVSDGEQIVVPAVGEAAAAPPSGGAVGTAAGGAASGGAVSGGAVSGGAVDLNSADEAALETLNGVGPATAAAILAWRDEHGRFESIEDLLDVSGIGEKKLEKMRDGVTVR